MRRDGCWHYDYERYCTQCDPASYGPCPRDCREYHECCTCDLPEGCALHDDEEEDEEEGAA